MHIWYLPVRTGNRDGLNGPELTMAARFHQADDADRFSTARQGLRRLAGAYLGLYPSEILLQGARHEKPVIGNLVLQPLHFNSSHSGQVILIAFSRRPVGVDVEKIRQDFDFRSLLSTQFTEKERNALNTAGNPLPEFYRLWTRKEALVKGWGTGLQEELAAVPVSEDLIAAPGKAESWQLMSFTPCDGYVAAVAGPGIAKRILFYRETQASDPIPG